MKNDWIATVKFPDMPEDADEDSMRLLLSALLDSNGEIPYEIVKVEQQ